MKKYIRQKTKKKEGIRLLDIDDLYIIYRISVGDINHKEIATSLLLTPPAISYRLTKHKKVFGKIYKNKRNGQTSRLNKNGLIIAKKCETALRILLDDEQ